ncbi:putative ribonuclease H-like domain-containing protein [Tanacetum coccineum]
MALMAFSDSDVYTDKNCSKTCLNNYETLKKQYDDLLAKLHECYSGLDEFKDPEFKGYCPENSKQESNVVCESKEVVVLKREVGVKQYEINMFKTEFEKVKQEKYAIDFKIEKFGKASKYLDQLLGSQITDKKPEFKGYGPENNQGKQVKSSFVEGCGSNTSKSVSEVEPKKVWKNNDTPILRIGSKSVMAWVPQLDDKGFVDSGCSRHMTGNITYLLISSSLMEVMLHLEEVHMVVINFCADENQILLKIPRKDNMYSFDMKNIVPKESLTCLVAKATLDESMLWHRRFGHINFKNINKLVKDNLVRGLPTKRLKMTKPVLLVLKGSNTKLLDETSEILKHFIKEIENLVDKKVKIIRSDNGTEFKNKVIDDFCREKGIKRHLVCRILKQNGVAERRNRTLIEAARTMLADSKLPTTFWAEVFYGGTIGCHVTILNTLDSLGKFDGKSDEGFFIGYSLSSKAFMVKDSLNNENAKQERFADDSSSKDVNAVGKQVNTASPDVNTGSLKLNAVGPSVSTASPNEEDNTEEEPGVDLGNITNSLCVPTLPITRIHKYHLIDNVIGEVQSTVQTRRMSKPTSDQGFLSDIEPTSIAKALSDSSWVEMPLEQNGSSETRKKKGNCD